MWLRVSGFWGCLGSEAFGIASSGSGCRRERPKLPGQRSRQKPVPEPQKYVK